MSILVLYCNKHTRLEKAFEDKFVARYLGSDIKSLPGVDATDNDHAQM